MNEIDLYKDLAIAEKCLKKAESKDEKRYWKAQIKSVTETIKEMYPELCWNK